MKHYKVAILAALALGMTAGNASAATIELVDSAFLLNGSAATVDAAGFDSGTGLGTITTSISGADSYNFIAYFDHEIDQTINTFFNETGAAVGTPNLLQSWEIDEPGFGDFTNDYLGDIYSNAFVGTLDNQSMHGVKPSDSSLTDFTGPQDVSMAMGWDFLLDQYQTAVISMSISEIMPTNGFYLVHTDPDTIDLLTGALSPTTIYFSSTIRITGSAPPPPPPGGDPVPEPATLLLMGTGLAGLYGARRKKAA